MEVSFNGHLDSFPVLNQYEISEWLVSSIENEGKKLGNVDVNILSDIELLRINQKFLNHDTFTDIITFDYSEREVISGELLISYDRILENAQKYNAPISKELHRVLIHGILHLCGYSDRSAEEKTQMTEKEDYYLSLRTF